MSLADVMDHTAVIMRRHVGLLILVGAIAAGVGLVAHYLLPEQYQASTQIVMLSNAGELTKPSDLAAGQTLARNYAALVKSDAVLIDVTKQLGGRYDSEALRNRLTVTPSKESFYLTVTAAASRSQEAADIVNAVSSAFLKRVEGVRVQVAAPIVANLQEEITTLSAQVKTIDGRIATNAAQDSPPAGDPNVALVGATVRNQTLATLLDSRARLQERLSAANAELRLTLSKQHESAVLWSPALAPDHSERAFSPLLVAPAALACILVVAVLLLLREWSRAPVGQPTTGDTTTTSRDRSGSAQPDHAS